jgi:hypothetical protein
MDFRSDTPWTDADIDRLASMYFATPKTPVEVMAARLGRTTNAIWTEVSRRGVSKPGAQIRTCLPCDRDFFSSWIGERICQFCKKSEMMRCA